LRIYDITSVDFSIRVSLARIILSCFGRDLSKLEDNCFRDRILEGFERLERIQLGPMRGRVVLQVHYSYIFSLNFKLVSERDWPALVSVSSGLPPSVTVVRGWPLLVTAAIRDCPSSFHLVLEPPNVFFSYPTLSNNISTLSATVCSLLPPSIVIRRRSSVWKPPDSDCLSER